MSDSSKCGVCSKDSTFVCSRCKGAKYCSVDCQKADWKSHKTTCFPKANPPPPDNERCLTCKGWGKDLLGTDQLCAHCRAQSK